MTRPPRIAAGLLVAVLVAAACTGDGDPGPGPDGSTCRVAKPRRGDVPVAVDGVGEDVWMVGAHYEGGAGVPFARRWDGRLWDPVPVEIVEDVNAGFHDVDALSEDDAWAVGSLRGAEPMVQRWDGSAWTSVVVPSIGFEESELFGVTAVGARPVWSVGRALDARRWRPLILRWDEGGWDVVDAPSPAADATLRAVDSVDRDDVWAVGWSAAPGGRHRTLALHFDGTAWRRIATPNPEGGDHLLSSVVAAAGDEAWAVGWSIGADGRDRPLILRWNGSRWQVSPSPELDGRAQLIDVAASGPGDVWAAGRVTDATQTFGSLLLRLDGGRWRRVPTPNVGADDDTLAGVAVTDGGLWGVGTSVDAEGRYTSLVLSGC